MDAVDIVKRNLLVGADVGGFGEDGLEGVSGKFTLFVRGNRSNWRKLGVAIAVWAQCKFRSGGKEADGGNS